MLLRIHHSLNSLGMNNVELKKVGQLLVEFAERNKEKWNELDGNQGDGDLGITVFLGAKAMADTAESCKSIKEWFELGGKALRKAAPSTMGILIASALIAAGKSIHEDKNVLSLNDWVSIQQCMIDEIQRRGGAKLGDKTVLDTLIPAVNAFRDAVNSEKDLIEVLTETVNVAKDSAENTALLVSKIGRSSWLGDRVQNHIDGGAWVCYQLYEFLLTLIKTEKIDIKNPEER